MRIFITTMDEPLYTNAFIKQIICERKEDIIGLAISEGNRFTITKTRSKLAYFTSLFLIMGPYHFTKNLLIEITFRMRKIISRTFHIIPSPSILNFASRQGIKTYVTRSVNDKEFLGILEEAKPDVIINQTQNFLKKKFLSIPSVGVINRHNALLPRNRGRLSPFWVLYKCERETGVSIHFVNEELDAGDIIVQRKIEIEENENFNSLVQKCYEIASQAMLEALDLLEAGHYTLIHNDKHGATYNTIPTLRQALMFRYSRIRVTCR